MMDRGARELRLIVRAMTIDFSNRDISRLGLARLGVSFASWCFTIALGVYGFESHGAVGVGLVAAVRLLPGALASPFAGLLSDRHPRRSIMFWSTVAMAAVLGGATVAAAFNAPSPIVFAFPALFAVAASGYGPAESALSATLARTPQQLSAGNVRHNALETSGFLLAALLNGFLLTATSPALIFGVAAAVALFAAFALSAVPRDRRPHYLEDEGEIAGVIREIAVGLEALKEHPGVRLATAVLVMLHFFEGFAGVLAVVMALDLLHLGSGSVGFLNATWGIGALVGGAGLALLLDRNRLVIAIAGGSLLVGIATMIPGIWPVTIAAFVAWAGIGIGYNFAEVAAKTLLQRLASDETLGRVLSALETGRLTAMALGSIGATAIVELTGVRNSLILLALVPPIFTMLCWARLRALEIGAPVAEEHYRLLRENSIFAPLPIATVERLSHDLATLEVGPGEDVIVQGDIGDRFYLIDQGQVEVLENGDFRRTEGRGESFGEIALLRQVPRTATVRATEATRLLVLGRDQFLTAVTGHSRSHQLAHIVAEDRWTSQELPATAD
jgi:MFS family permease